MSQMFIKGADISTLNEVEALGGKYYFKKSEKDLFEILKINGIDTIRLRLWVDPYDKEKRPYMGGTNDLQTTLDLAKRAKKQEMKILLNFHYSDFWTDPKKQYKPKSWELLSSQQLELKVYEYTKQVITECANNNIVPEYIQIGNEITNGMLWPEGKTPTFLFKERKYEEIEESKRKASYDQLSRFLKAGIQAIKDNPLTITSKIILHLDFGGENNLYRIWFDEMIGRNVEFDIIGLSYYPFWHGNLKALQFNLNDISSRYDKDVLIVETSYGFTPEDLDGNSIFTKELSDKAGYPSTVKGQGEFLYDLMKTVQKTENNRGLGIFYWEPAWLPLKGTSWASYEGMKYGNDIGPTGNHWANQALFDFEGNALESLNVFKNF